MSSVPEQSRPRRGLGRGLEVLIGGAGTGELAHLPVEAIHPNPRLTIAGVLLTMVDRRTRLSADVEHELRSHLGDLVFRTAVPRSVRLAEAPSHGLPAIAYDRRSAGAEAYWKVAMELVDRT